VDYSALYPFSLFVFDCLTNFHLSLWAFSAPLALKVSLRAFDVIDRQDPVSTIKTLYKLDIDCYSIECGSH
jgi:hypothetical protein